MTPLERAEREARLRNIADAATTLSRLVSGRSFEEYKDDIGFRWSIERGLGVVGEAVARLRKIDPQISGHITAVPQIVAFRNTLIHEYATIEDEQVWAIVRDHLPVLLREVESLLSPPLSS